MTRTEFMAHFAGHEPVLRRIDDVRFPSSGCWEYPTGPTFRYAKRKINGRLQYLHRLSLEIARGEALGSLESCHSCDNPPCINPAHLFAGTHADNGRDMSVKGRWGNKVMRGEDNPKAYPTAIVEAARADYLNGSWSQTALAQKYSVSRGAIRGWLSGARSDAGDSILRPPSEPDCGTRAGARAHLRRGERPCGPCGEASRAYARAGYARRSALREAS